MLYIAVECVFLHILILRLKVFCKKITQRRETAMKKILSCTKAAITILLVTVLFLGLYAAKINAFRETAVGPGGYATIYTCTGTIIFAVAVGALALALIELSVFSFALSKKEVK
jgi:hypothetical protein